MADIPALSLIQDQCSKIPVIQVEDELKLSDIKAYNRRAISFVDDCNCSFERIAEYTLEIHRQLEIFQRELKTQMAKQTDLMKNLLQRIAQEEDKKTFNGGIERRAKYRDGIVTRTGETEFRGYFETQTEQVGGNRTVTDYSIDCLNEIKNTIKLNQKQEKLLALDEKCCNILDDCKNDYGYFKNFLQNLKQDLDGYANMIETAEEKQKRKEEEEKERQRLEREKKEKEEREKWRRNPENWKPFIYYTKKKELAQITGDDTVCCVVYAMPESVSKSQMKCSVLQQQTELQKWLDRPREQQMSLPVLVTYEGTDPISFEVPMRLYIPYITSGSTQAPKLKLSIDDDPWKYPEILPEREITETDGVVLYLGSEVTSFRSFKAIVVGIPMHDTINVPRKGCTIKRGPCEIKIPPNTFELETANVCVEEFKDCEEIINSAKKTEKSLACLQHAQVVKLTCNSPPKKAIQVNYSEKEHDKEAKMMSASKESLQCLKESKTIKRDPFMNKLLDAGLITTAQKSELQKIRIFDLWLKFLLAILSDKPSELGKVIQCLKDSDNGELATKIQTKVKEMTKKTSAQAPSTAVFLCQTDDVPKVSGNKIQVKHPVCNLTFLRTDERAAQDAVEHAAKNLNHYLYGITATLLCRQKHDPPTQCFLQIVESQNVPLQIQRLNDLGFKGGPMDTAEFCIFDNEIVAMHFKGNIGLEYNGERFFGEKPLEIPFRMHMDAVKVNGALFVVDEKVAGEHYSGNLTYTIEAFEQTPKRQDSVPLFLPKKEDLFKYICLYPRVKALTKFIAHHIVRSEQSGAEWLNHMSDLDEPSVIDKIHKRVGKQEKNSTEQIQCEAFMAIWVNEDPDDENRLEELVGVLKDTELQKEAKAYVELCSYKGFFSNKSIKEMAKMMGPEWKSLAYDHLGMTTDDVSFVQRFSVDDEANHRAMLLDRFRFSDNAIQLGCKLPEHFLDAIQKSRCSKELIQYCKSKTD